MYYSELKRDLYFGIATLLFGAGYFASCFSTITVRANNIGVSGRTFPLIVSVILLILGVSLVYSTFKRLKALPESFTKRYYPLFERKQLLSMVIYFGSLCLYILGIEYVGYVVSTVLITAFLLKFNLAKSKIAFVAVTVLLPGFLYWIFSIAMEVQLPLTPLP